MHFFLLSTRIFNCNYAGECSILINSSLLTSGLWANLFFTFKLPAWRLFLCTIGFILPMPELFFFLFSPFFSFFFSFFLLSTKNNALFLLSTRIFNCSYAGECSILINLSLLTSGLWAYLFFTFKLPAWKLFLCTIGFILPMPELFFFLLSTRIFNCNYAEK